MDLINDLGNDLALAFLVEKKYKQKLDSREALDFIRLVKAILQPISQPDRPETVVSMTDHKTRAISH